MKTEQEIVDSRIALRLICGFLAVGGAVAITWRAFQAFATGEFGWLEVFSSAGALYGVYLFGYLALKGALPFKHSKSSNA